MNVTYAFFTATAKNSNAVNKTGLIKIMFDPITKQLNTTDISGTAQVFPGDTLNINGSLLNDGNNDCYAILEFEVYVQKYGASTKETAVHKYYAYEGSTLKEITGTTGSYSTYASIISSTSGSNKKSFNLSYKFTGEKYDNSYKKATVTYAVYGYAIQTANISQTKATEELLDTAGYKYLTVYGNSVQNGTPSPANPVEIQSVGEKTKNLFDGYWEIGALSTTNGSNLPSSSSLRSNYIQLNPNTNYYITLPAGSNYYPFLYNTNKQFSRYLGLRVGSFSFTTSSSEYYFKIMQYNSTLLPTKIQLEEGSTATEYEPYGYKIPINVKSKNLVDIPSTTVSGTSNWTTPLIGDFSLPSGTYTISCNFVQNGTDLSTVYLDTREYEKNTPLYGSKRTTDARGKLSMTFTIPEGKNGFRLYFSSNCSETAKNTSCDFSNIQVEKGETATEYELPSSYYSNLFDKSTIKNGYIKSNGAVENVTWMQCTDYIDISGNDGYITYAYSQATNSTSRYIAFYNSSKTFINGEIQKDITQGISSTIAVPSGAKYVRLNISPDLINSAVVVRGKDYSRYSQSTTYVYIDEPLRKVGNYADYIDLQTGTLVRQVGFKVLDGSESWKFETSSSTYYLAINDRLATTTCPMISNYFEYVKPSVAVPNIGQFRSGASTNTMFNYDNTVGGIEGWISFLETQYANNSPVVVQYALATPTETTISVPDLGQFSGSVIEVGTSVSPSSTVSNNNTRIPSEYQMVEYIQSTGTQYINTGFTPNQDTRVVCDFQVTEMSAAFVFGSRTSV